MKTKTATLVLATISVFGLGHSAYAEEASKTVSTPPQSAAMELHGTHQAMMSKDGKHAMPDVAYKSNAHPADNDHDPRFQKLKIHDPGYTADMSFE